jgi:hypothetical protein
MFRNESFSTILQAIILILLLIAAPYAMSLTPYERIYTDGVWKAPLHSDPLYPVRTILILGGLVAAVFSVSLLVWELAKGRATASCRILQASMALFSLQIGWLAFPFWVNGVFQAYSGNAPSNAVLDFDPAALMPMIWVGEIWRLGASLLYVGSLAGVIALFIFNCDITIVRRTWKQGLVTLILLVMTFSVFYVTPNYVQWLAD